MLNKSILINEVQRLQAAYRELLKIENTTIRSACEPLMCQLRDKISQLTLTNPQVVQETNEQLARAEKSQAKYFTFLLN